MTYRTNRKTKKVFPTQKEESLGEEIERIMAEWDREDYDNYAQVTKFGGRLQNVHISNIEKESVPIEEAPFEYYLQKISKHEKINPIVIESSSKRYETMSKIPGIQIEKPTHMYHLVDGRHRLGALRRLGYKYVHAEII